MKKYLCIILALCPVLTLLSGCVEKSDSGAVSGTTASVATSAIETETVTQAETNVTSDVPKLDYDGYVFKIIGHGSDNTAVDILVDEENGDVVNDAKILCFQQTEEHLNIIFENYLVNSVASTVSKAVLSGSTDFDAEAVTLPDSLKLVSKNIFLPVDKLTYVDTDKSYWSQSLDSELSVANAGYLLIGDMFTRTAEWANVIMFNKELWANYQLEDLYAIVENGSWTIDKMTAMMSGVSADINGDGAITDVDQFGLAATNATVGNFFFSSGLRYTEKGSDDIPQLLPFSERMADVFAKTDNLTKQEYFLESSWDVIYNAFRDGRSLFYAEILAKMGLMRDLDMDIGILPYPKYDEAQEAYYTTTADSILALSVPSTSENPERTSAVLDYYAYAASQTVRPAYYNVTLTYKNIRSEYDIKMLDIILSSIVYDFAYFLPSVTIDNIFADILAKDGNTFASSYEANFNKNSETLAKWIDSVRENA